MASSDEVEIDVNAALAKLAAEEAQNLAHVAALAHLMGEFYKELRRNGVPRKLRREMVHDFFIQATTTASMASLLEGQNGSSDED